MSRLYPCIYYTEDGHCEKYSNDEVTSWCVQGPCKDETPSNADRVRRMSDEELAEWYWWMLKYTQGYTDSRWALLDWLKKESE